MHVVHLVDTYLDYSRTWIHHQIDGVPDVRTSVVAVDVVDDGPTRFPVADLHVLRPGAGAYTRWALGRPSLRQQAIQAVAPLDLLRDADVAHAHFGDVAWAFLPSVLAAGLPLATSFYGIDLSRLPATAPVWRRRYGELFAHGAVFFCEGPAMAADLAGLGCPPEKIRVQRLGVDTSRFPVLPRPRRPGDALRLLLVARFTEKKGIPDAIRAVALASREVDVRLTVVGDAPPRLWPFDAERRERRRIRAAVRRFHVADRVTFAGRVAYDALPGYAATHDVLIQPSKRSALGDTEGGAPVSLIELAATGLPAIATRHADIPQVVDDGATGLLADEGDVAGLSRHVVRLARDRELAGTLGARASRHVCERFGLDACRRTLAARYREVVAGPAGPRPEPAASSRRS